MMGNSWLAISQINFASRFTHPNLKAIAPWEALTDPYDHSLCRASHHVSLLPESEKDGFPRYDHKSRQDIPAGTIIPLLIPIWPVGMVFEAGEGLMLRVSGHDMSLPEVEMMRLREPVDENVGVQVVHTGGEYESSLVVPVI